jgi:hypothetical protein
VPVGGEMALNCAILTYNGTAYFGFSGDVHAAPDLRRLEGLLQSSFTELREAAGVTPPRKKAEIKNKKRVPAKARVASTSKLAPTAVPVSASVPIRPLASVKTIPTRPPVMEEKVLTPLIA